MYRTHLGTAGFVVLFVSINLALAELPASFDWRTQGACTPPKLVQACIGSTWAFATTAVMESAILIQDGVSTDLSEQWLISCNLEGWDCQNGTWPHGLEYFQYKQDLCGDTGPVLEANLPFDGSGSNLPCDCPYPHQARYLLDNWHYVGDATSIPDVDAMKRAIMDHGPVVVGIHTNSAYWSYTGGVLTGCETGPINRAVVVVGWDDHQGPGGVWFVREAWGTFWGESGYGRIPYGCDDIGYAAAYAEYPGAHDLHVSPYNHIARAGSATSLAARGPVGGPFDPPCRVYTLTNLGNIPITWSASGTQGWLNITPSGGTIPAHEAVDVDVCINANAHLLAAGYHTDTVTFENTTAGKVRNRHVTLVVGQYASIAEFFQENDNDLDNTMLTFIPDMTNSFYSVCAEPIAAFPTDPQGGTGLPNVGHNKHNTVDLGPNTMVWLYGVGYSTFHVSTNGYITFTEPDTDYSASLSDHFRLPRISALFDRLYVLSPITLKQLSDRVAVTFQNVTQDVYPGSNNSFQIEMFVDGRIRLSYLDVECPNGLVGLSAGNGVPADFTEADLSGGADFCGYPFNLPDFDFDLDIDQSDYGFFQACLGAARPMAPQCARANLSPDSQIDADDTNLFLGCRQGPGVPGDPSCLE